MMSNFNDKLALKLIELWAMLDEDDRSEVLDHARWLAGDSRLRGGPMDGLKVPEKHKDAVSIAIEIGDRVALYSRDDDLFLRFEGFHQKGGEGGRWPDVKAQELAMLQGGAT